MCITGRHELLDACRQSARWLEQLCFEFMAACHKFPQWVANCRSTEIEQTHAHRLAVVPMCLEQIMTTSQVWPTLTSLSRLAVAFMYHTSILVITQVWPTSRRSSHLPWLLTCHARLMATRRRRYTPRPERQSKKQRKTKWSFQQYGNGFLGDWNEFRRGRCCCLYKVVG